MSETHTKSYPERRSSDPIISEIREMIVQMNTKFESNIHHTRVIQDLHKERLDRYEDKINPVIIFYEKAVSVINVLIWVVKYSSIPILTGFGVGLWWAAKYLLIKANGG